MHVFILSADRYLCISTNDIYFPCFWSLYKLYCKLLCNFFLLSILFMHFYTSCMVFNYMSLIVWIQWIVYLFSYFLLIGSVSIFTPVKTILQRLYLLSFLWARGELLLAICLKVGAAHWVLGMAVFSFPILTDVIG